MTSPSKLNLKMGVLFLSSLTLIGLFSSCSASVNNNQSSFSYNLTENGCSTGEKTFSSNDAMCSALKDDSLNQYCAQSLRYQKFTNDCPGKTW